MKTVKVSGWVAKLAWDQTVGGTQCVPSLQTGSQLGPNLVVNGLAEKHASRCPGQPAITVAGGFRCCPED